MIKDSKFSYKANLIAGIGFLLGSIIYFYIAISTKESSKWLVAIGSLIASLSWFALSYINYKKSIQETK